MPTIRDGSDSDDSDGPPGLVTALPDGTQAPRKTTKQNGRTTKPKPKPARSTSPPAATHTMTHAQLVENHTSLINRFNNLQTEYSEQTEMLEEQEAKIQELEEKLRNKEDGLAEARSALSTSAAELRDSQGETESLERELHAAERRNATLKTEVQKSSEVQRTLRDELQTAQKQTKELKKQVAEYTASDVKVEHVWSELNAEKEKTVKLRETLAERKVEAEKRQQDLADELRIVKAERDSARDQLAAAEPAPPPTSTEIGRLRHELQSALATISRLSPLQAQLKQSYTRLAPANHRIKGLEQSLASTEKKLAKVERELMIKSNENDIISATARTTAQQEAATTIATLKEELARAMADVQSTHRHSQTVRDSLSHLEEQLNANKLDLSATNRELAMLRTDITILQKSNENMKNETRQVETVSVEAMTRISSLETKLADAESSLAQKEAERAEMSEKLTHSWRAERDRCDELDLLRDRTSALKSDHEQQYSSIRYELDAAYARIHQLEDAGPNYGSMGDLKDELTSVKHELYRLQDVSERTMDVSMIETSQNELLEIAKLRSELEQKEKEGQDQRRASAALIDVLKGKYKQSEEAMQSIQGGLAAYKELLGRERAENEVLRLRLDSLEKRLEWHAEQRPPAPPTSSHPQRRPSTSPSTSSSYGLMSPPSSPELHTNGPLWSCPPVDRSSNGSRLSSSLVV